MTHAFIHKFRKAAILIAVLLLMASLTGCWEKGDPDNPPGQTNTPASEQGGTPTETSSQDQPEQTQQPSVQVPTEAPTQAPTAPPTEAPTQPPETKPVPEKSIGMITATELNIRSNPGTQYKAVGTYFKGRRVQILETQDSWGRTDRGWINLKYVTFDGVSQDPIGPEDLAKDILSDGNTKAKGYGVVTIGALNIRTGPASTYDDIGEVKLCSRYPYYQKSGNWLRLEEGWVSATYFYIEGNQGDGAGKGKVTGSDLMIRVGPGTTYEAKGTYDKDDKVEILAQVNGWGYTSKGWISMKYVELEQATEDKPEEKPTEKPAETPKETKAVGTVTATGLNIRKEPNEKADVVGSYGNGETVTILEIKEGWGRTDKGWISMKYVKLNSFTGTITASALFIRKEAKKDAESLGSYEKGTVVKILEVKDGWGRTDKGWISLDYVKISS